MAELLITDASVVSWVACFALCEVEPGPADDRSWYEVDHHQQCWRWMWQGYNMVYDINASPKRSNSKTWFMLVAVTLTCLLASLSQDSDLVFPLQSPAVRQKSEYICVFLSLCLFPCLCLCLFTCPPRCHWSKWGGWTRFETSHSRETSPPWKKRYIEFDFQKPSQYFSGITVGIWFWESILDWTYIYIG